jgi:hypothetical protein
VTGLSYSEQRTNVVIGALEGRVKELQAENQRLRIQNSWLRKGYRDRSKESDEAFAAEVARIEAAPSELPADCAATHGGEPCIAPYDSALAARFTLLGDPFRPEGEPGVDG